MLLMAVLESGRPTGSARLPCGSMGLRLPAIALGVLVSISLPALPPIIIMSVEKITSLRTLLSVGSTILKSLRIPSANRLINEYGEALYRIARSVA